jgi:hypothetical protein
VLNLPCPVELADDDAANPPSPDESEIDWQSITEEVTPSISGQWLNAERERFLWSMMNTYKNGPDGDRKEELHYILYLFCKQFPTAVCFYPREWRVELDTWSIACLMDMFFIVSTLSYVPPYTNPFRAQRLKGWYERSHRLERYVQECVAAHAYSVEGVAPSDLHSTA